MGRYCVRLNVDRLIVVGEEAEPIAKGAYLEGFSDEDVAQVTSAAAALELLRTQVAPGDVVLVKSSRIAGLEAVATALLDALERNDLPIPSGRMDGVATTARGTEEAR